MFYIAVMSLTSTNDVRQELILIKFSEIWDFDSCVIYIYWQWVQSLQTYS